LPLKVERLSRIITARGVKNDDSELALPCSEMKGKKKKEEGPRFRKNGRDREKSKRVLLCGRLEGMGNSAF